jgi:hypothetical protein
VGDDIHRFEGAELTARACADDDGAIHVTLVGCADARVMGPMVELLDRVHDEALRTSAKETTVDFRALDFMNSSCFKAFVSWISRVQELPPEAQYRIRFVSDATKHWQRRSLGALSCFAVDLVRIEG